MFTTYAIANGSLYLMKDSTSFGPLGRRTRTFLNTGEAFETLRNLVNEPGNFEVVKLQMEASPIKRWRDDGRGR